MVTIVTELYDSHGDVNCQVVFVFFIDIHHPVCCCFVCNYKCVCMADDDSNIHYLIIVVKS